MSDVASPEKEPEIISKGQAQAIVDRYVSGWTFAYSSSRRRLGVCKYTEKRIEISAYLSILHPEKVMNTLLHEIAHAIVGHAAGHGPVWVNKALELGCDGRRCGEDMGVERTYKGHCSVCNKIVGRFKRPKAGRYFHKICGREATIIWENQ